MQYYLIIFGLRFLKITDQPVANEIEACENVMGFYDESAKVYPLGIEKPKQSPQAIALKIAQAVIDSKKNQQ